MVLKLQTKKERTAEFNEAVKIVRRYLRKQTRPGGSSITIFVHDVAVTNIMKQDGFIVKDNPIRGRDATKDIGNTTLHFFD